MDLKKKLVELLWEYDQMRMMRMSIEECVERLIENGVTVQEWISVKDRLPELIPCNAGTAYSEAVIVWTDNRKAMIAVWMELIFCVPLAIGKRGVRISPIGCPCPNRRKENDYEAV